MGLIHDIRHLVAGRKIPKKYYTYFHSSDRPVAEIKQRGLHAAIPITLWDDLDEMLSTVPRSGLNNGHYSYWQVDIKNPDTDLLPSPRHAGAWVNTTSIPPDSLHEIMY